MTYSFNEIIKISIEYYPIYYRQRYIRHIKSIYLPPEKRKTAFYPVSCGLLNILLSLFAFDRFYQYSKLLIYKRRNSIY